MLTCPPFTPNRAEDSGGAVESQPTRRTDLVQQVQEVIARVEEYPDPAARQLIHGCLQSVLALYGQGLARIVELVGNGSTDQIIGRFLDDELIRGLLLIHGLHPQDLQTRVNGALDKVRPYLQTHGGNVELVSLEDDIARLRLLGACKGCPSSTLTMQNAIRRAMEEACPDLAGLELDGEEELKCV